LKLKELKLNILDTTLKIMNPETNNIHSYTYKELSEKIKSNDLQQNRQEMWTDSPCVFIKKDSESGVIDYMRKKYNVHL